MVYNLDAICFTSNSVLAKCESGRRRKNVGGTVAGMVILYLFFAVVAFLIAALILRAIFRINKIVDLLASIDSRLQSFGSAISNTRVDTVKGSDSEQEDRPAAPRTFGMAVGELSVGNKLETPDGKCFEVVDFSRNGLKVKGASGDVEVLRPMNPNAPGTKWVFEVRQI